MNRRAIASGTVLTAVLAVGCHRNESDVSGVEPYLSDAASVGFDLESAPTADGSQCFIATYESNRKITKFRIELGPANASGGAHAEPNMAFGEGRLMPLAGSDSSGLMAALQKALQAKTQPAPVPERTSVAFEYANIGDHLSQQRGGGFGAKPPGNWTALKLFFGKGQSESEVFLNINPKSKMGQFSMKDPDYGDLLLVEFAKVL